MMHQGLQVLGIDAELFAGHARQQHCQLDAGGKQRVQQHCSLNCSMEDIASQTFWQNWKLDSHYAATDEAASSL